MVDIQTGRNVYVDVTRLGEDPDYKEEIRRYVAEGFFPVSGDPETAFNTMAGDDSEGGIH